MMTISESTDINQIITTMAFYSIRTAPSVCKVFLLLTITLFAYSSCKKDKPKSTGCPSVSPAGTRLTQAGSAGPFTYRSSGGGIVFIDPDKSIKFTHNDYPGFMIELWGDTTINGKIKTAANHESLNGKHLKDKLTNIRTIIFPDGTKITMTGDGVYGPLSGISIYEGNESHHINPSCNTLIHSSNSLATAQQRDAAEPDGETATYEISATGLIYVNIYTEVTPGNKVMQRVILGEIFRAQPNKVNDYFDDPRMAHT